MSDHNGPLYHHRLPSPRNREYDGNIGYQENIGHPRNITPYFPGYRHNHMGYTQSDHPVCCRSQISLTPPPSQGYHTPDVFPRSYCDEKRCNIPINREYLRRLLDSSVQLSHGFNAGETYLPHCHNSTIISSHIPDHMSVSGFRHQYNPNHSKHSEYSQYSQNMPRTGQDAHSRRMNNFNGCISGHGQSYIPTEAPVYSPIAGASPYTYAPDHLQLRPINNSLIHSLCNSSSNSFLNESGASTERRIDAEVSRRVANEMSELLRSLPASLGDAIRGHATSGCNEPELNRPTVQNSEIRTSHGHRYTHSTRQETILLPATGIPEFNESNSTSRGITPQTGKSAGGNSHFTEPEKNYYNISSRGYSSHSMRRNSSGLDDRDQSVNDYNAAYNSDGGVDSSEARIDTKYSNRRFNDVQYASVRPNEGRHSFSKPYSKRSSFASASTIPPEYGGIALRQSSLLGRVSLGNDSATQEADNVPKSRQLENTELLTDELALNKTSLRDKLLEPRPGVESVNVVFADYKK